MQNRAQWCKTKMQVTLYFESQWAYREFYLHNIIKNLVYLFRLGNISVYNLNYNNHYCFNYFLIMIIFHIPKLWKKTDFTFIWRFGAFSLKQQPENSPCKSTSPWVAGKFQETGPFVESVSFSQFYDVH